MSQPSLFDDRKWGALRPLRPRQASAIDAIRQAVREGHKRIVVQAPTGFGKCHGAGTEVIMYDGRLRKVEDVLPGEALMGPDSKPRKVLNTVQGYGPLYCVTPAKGEPFVCNDAHVLSLKSTRYWQQNGAGGQGKWKSGTPVNIPVRDYIVKSAWFKHVHKLWRTGVDFPESPASERPVDPYFLGVLLGDGSIVTSIGVTTMDSEIVAEVYAQANKYGLSVRKAERDGNQSSTYFFSGKGKDCPLRRGLWWLSLHGKRCDDKFIPYSYLTAPRKDRLELLAGLIDTDGHVFSNHLSIEFANKSLRLIEGFEFLARSLGFGCGRCSSIVNGVTYYRVHIHGDYSVIPMRIARKRVAKRRLQKKDVLMTGFTVDFIGNGDYYGFALDGDHLYLLRDFTVTHNTLLAAHLIHGSIAKGKRPLFTVPALTLINQTLASFEAEGISDIGVIQAQHERTDWLAQVQIASVQTLIRRALPEVDLVIVDECHLQFSKLNERVDAPEWKDKIVLGLSATPWAKGMGLRWTKLIVAATVAELIEDGHLSPFLIYAPAEPDLSGVKIVKGEYEEKGLSEVMGDAVLVADVVTTWQEKGQGLPTFLFAVDCAHAQKLQAEFQSARISCGYIDAHSDDDQRRETFRRFRSGDDRIIASVGCLTTGVDEDVRCIIDAAPTRSEMRHVQKIGRGLRTAPGKDVLLILDHAGNTIRLGMVTDILHDRLDTRKPGERGEAFEDEPKPLKPKKCHACQTLIPPKQRVCPECALPVVRDSAVQTKKGELVEFGSGKKAKAVNYTMAEKQAFYSGMLALCRERGKADGMAAHRYREKFSVWPNQLQKVPGPITPEVRSFDTAMRIRYIKGREKAAKHA